MYVINIGVNLTNKYYFKIIKRTIYTVDYLNVFLNVTRLTVFFLKEKQNLLILLLKFRLCQIKQFNILKMMENLP